MIGETLGQKYRLLRLLGRGGMGAVYEAEVAGSGERVAVKVLHGHLVVPGGEGPRRFRREAAAVRAVRGDHIIHVLDAAADEHTGQLYLVTELLDGEDLQKMLDRVGPLAEAGAVGVAAQALRGLMEAHAAGVIHRDIKPANLFLSKRPDGALVVKLLDFGIAKLDIPLAAAPTADLASVDLTTTGSFLGSPLYMSPEQVQSSRDVDARSDVWSLGCVLYAALAGRAPHQHLSSIGQLLVAICVSPAPPLREVAPWVPTELCDVVHRALEIRPEARYPSAAAMLEALRRFGTSDTLVDEMLASSGQSPRVAAYPSAPPSPLVGSPRVIVAPAASTDVRGDAPTQGARPRAPPSKLYTAQDPSRSTTLGSAPDPRWRGDDTGAPDAARGERSAVPGMGARAGSRSVLVDPRRLLGDKTELWSFSLDVHPHLGSLISRVWKSLRRGGARLPPMSYGTEWTLFDPRTARPIVYEPGEAGAKPGIEDSGIRPGAILWVVRPEEQESEQDSEGDSEGKSEGDSEGKSGRE